jgi:hypothetical protein
VWECEWETEQEVAGARGSQVARVAQGGKGSFWKELSPQRLKQPYPWFTFLINRSTFISAIYSYTVITT